uniref:Protein G6G8.9 n=1 Tax=Neurospora crassa TaxID=5141 RepID=Q9C1K9_NEUCS|nr:protein G6G8.9 [Neurospora crassa]
MGKPKRHVHAADQESLTPPDQLTDSQSIARVVKAEGNSNYICELPNKKTILVELESRFRNTIWIKRGGYVLVDLGSMEERSKTGSKVVGEIINIVRDEKAWRKEAYWYVTLLLQWIGWRKLTDGRKHRPKQFVRQTYDESEDEESTVGKLPPSDSEDEKYGP